MEIPKVLNIGSGRDFRKECVNLDKDNLWKPDIVCNLNYPFREDERTFFDTVRFGTIEFKEGMFEKIIANDVLEHITNLTTCMKSCLDLLEVGGVMEIIVPYDLSLGAWQDPTHVRAFNQMSWIYYTDWSWYLGWKKEKFKTQKLEFKIAKFGQNLEKMPMKLEEIINIPRAIEAMRVELIKIIDKTSNGGNGNDKQKQGRN